MLKIGSECGRPWYRLYSWLRWDRIAKRYKLDAQVRMFKRSRGFAVGPIMVWWRE